MLSGWPPVERSRGLGVTPDVVLMDGNWDFVGGGNTRTIVKGDDLPVDRGRLDRGEGHPRSD